MIRRETDWAFIKVERSAVLSHYENARITSAARTWEGTEAGDLAALAGVSEESARIWLKVGGLHGKTT